MQPRSPALKDGKKSEFLYLKITKNRLIIVVIAVIIFQIIEGIRKGVSVLKFFKAYIIQGDTTFD